MAEIRVNGSVTYLPTKYEYYITYEVLSQDTVLNQTSLRVRAYARKKSDYSSYTEAGTSQLQIDGSNSSKLTGLTVDLQANTNAQLLQSYTKTITHNADGTKTITIKGGEAVASGSGILGANDSSFSPYKGTATGSSIALPTIPREATISDANIAFTIGNDLPITVVNAGALFVRVITKIDGNTVKTENLGAVSGAQSLDLSTVKADIYALVPNALSIGGQLVVQTFTDGTYTTQVGSDKTYTITANVDQVDSKPTFTTASFTNVTNEVEVKDAYNDTVIKSNTYTLVGSVDSKIIKGFNAIRASILSANKMVAKNSATPSYYKLLNGIKQDTEAYSAGSTVNLDLSNVITESCILYAYDSRGLQSNIGHGFANMANYSAVSIFGLTLTRANSIDAITTLAFGGLMWNEYFGGGVAGTQNAITAHYRYKETTASWVVDRGAVTSISNANPTVITKTGHGLNTGDQVKFTTSSSLPTGLTVGTWYFVAKIDNNSFWVCPTYTDAVAGTNKIATSSAGAGTHNYHSYVVWNAITPSVDGSGNITFSDEVNGDLGASGFDPDKSFDIEVRVFDKLTSQIITGVLSVGTPLIHKVKEGVAFGQKHSHTVGNTIEVANKIIQDGEWINDIMDTKDDVIKEYIKTGWFPTPTATLTPRVQAFTSDNAIGANQVITMTDTSNFEVGDKVWVFSSAGNEIATVTAVSTNTSITVDALTLNHTTTGRLVFHATTNWTFVVTSNVDLTSYIGVGAKIRFTQDATTKYGIVVAITATKITIFGGTDYSATGTGLLTDLYVGRGETPQGFPHNPHKWQIELKDTSNRTQANPVSSTIYNLGSLMQQVPIGHWIVNLKGIVVGTRTSAGNVALLIGLSTANNSFSSLDLIGRYNYYNAASSTGAMTISFSGQDIIATSKTAYYLNESIQGSNLTLLGLDGTQVTTILTLECVYL